MKAYIQIQHVVETNFENYVHIPLNGCVFIKKKDVCFLVVTINIINVLWMNCKHILVIQYAASHTQLFRFDSCAPSLHTDLHQPP